MVKKNFFSVILLLLGILTISFVLFSIMRNNSTNEKEGSTMEKSKTLIVYYSRTGNTKAVAELIEEKVGGQLVQLETKEVRPSNYQEEVAQNQQEQESQVEPELKTSIPDLEEYDRIFIGAPTWSMALPQAVVTFLNNNDFNGKTVIPFNTNGGYGVGTSFDQIKTDAKGATVLEGFSVQGCEENNGVLLAIKDRKKVTVSRELDTWLKKIGQLEN
jgi:flavodoxin